MDLYTRAAFSLSRALSHICVECPTIPLIIWLNVTYVLSNIYRFLYFSFDLYLFDFEIDCNLFDCSPLFCLFVWNQKILKKVFIIFWIIHCICITLRLIPYFSWMCFTIVEFIASFDQMSYKSNCFTTTSYVVISLFICRLSLPLVYPKF